MSIFRNLFGSKEKREKRKEEKRQPDEVEALITTLQDHNELNSKRLAAAAALGEIKDVRVVEPLITALKDSGWKVWRAAVDALVQIGPSAVEPLITALKDSNADVQRGAAFALGVIKDVRAIEPLITALKDSNADVQRGAASALGEIKDVHAVEPLITALKDSNADVRKTAARALGEIKDVRAVESLVTAFHDIEYVRNAALAALGQIGDARAIEPLLPLLKDKDSDLRKAAAATLGQIGWQPTNNIQRAFYLAAQQDWAEALRIGADIELLIIALKDGGKDVQTAAVAALGQIGDARAIEPLITALKNLDKNVRRAAADALAQIDWQPTNNIQRAFYLAARQDWAEAIRIGADIELLIIALKDGGKDVQTAAVAALGQIGDARAIEPLLPLLKDKDSDLRKAAAEALGMIGWQPTENIQHAFYLAAQQDWAEALRIGADIDEFVEVYPHQVIRHIFKSALPKSAKLEIVLNKFGLASAVRENWIFCECGLPVQSRYRDNSIGVMYKFCSVETDKEDYYTNIYSCANCGRYVRSITS